MATSETEGAVSGPRSERLCEHTDCINAEGGARPATHELVGSMDHGDFCVPHVMMIVAAIVEANRPLPKEFSVRRISQQATLEMGATGRNLIGELVQLAEQKDASHLNNVLVRGLVTSTLDDTGLLDSGGLGGDKAAHLRLQARLLIDDGTGQLTANLDQRPTEQLLGKTRKECIDLARALINLHAIRNLIGNEIAGNPVELKGNVYVHSTGLILNVREVKVYTDLSPLEEAALLAKPDSPERRKADAEFAEQASDEYAQHKEDDL